MEPLTPIPSGLGSRVQLPLLRKAVDVITASIGGMIDTIGLGKFSSATEAVVHEVCHVAVARTGVRIRMVPVEWVGCGPLRRLAFPTYAVKHAITERGRPLRQEIRTMAAEIHLMRWIGEVHHDDLVEECLSRIMSVELARKRIRVVMKMSETKRSLCDAIVAASFMVRLSGEIVKRTDPEFGLPTKSVTVLGPS